ncbi:DUF2384 domain-containing protein [Microcystis elabens FACHB-917]|nr:DUF2384 domain-containing protein [Microcystis elabens FACHB-917]
MPRSPLAQSDAQLVAEACGRAALVLGLNKEGELALLLLRVYRSLHAHFGGDHALMRHWIEQPNHDLGEQPPRLDLQRIEALAHVANVLEALHS